MEFSNTAPIFLIGYRGTGKTTVAKLLAAARGCDWIDSDDEVERRAGKSIAAIFAEDGEAAFRRLEAQVLRGLGKRQGIIAALGGGAVLREDNRAAISQAGPIVLLTASVESLASRVANDPATTGRRPNLTSAGGQAEIETVLAERTPIYRECATLVIDTEGKTPAEVADEIVANL